jgi:hypothetical protein
MSERWLFWFAVFVTVNLIFLSVSFPAVDLFWLAFGWAATTGLWIAVTGMLIREATR